MLMKYPLSEEAEVSLSFAKEIVEKNNIEDNDNDLIFRSGVKFALSKDRKYNSSIMEFLNYVISLPNTKEKDSSLMEMVS